MHTDKGPVTEEEDGVRSCCGMLDVVHQHPLRSLVRVLSVFTADEAMMAACVGLQGRDGRPEKSLLSPQLPSLLELLLNRKWSKTHIRTVDEYLPSILCVVARFIARELDGDLNSSAPLLAALLLLMGVRHSPFAHIDFQKLGLDGNIAEATVSVGSHFYLNRGLPVANRVASCKIFHYDDERSRNIVRLSNRVFIGRWIAYQTRQGTFVLAKVVSYDVATSKCVGGSFGCEPRTPAR